MIEFGCNMSDIKIMAKEQGMTRWSKSSSSNWHMTHLICDNIPSLETVKDILAH